VRGYAAAGGRRDLPGFAVGDATAQAARRAGLRVQVAGGDAQALLRHLAAVRPAGPLLHVRGEHARGDVAARLCQTGLETREVVLYRQILLPPNDAARRALRGSAPVVVPLFSPRTAEQFAAQHTGRAPLYIAAMSRAVADKVAHLPVRRLLVAERPDAPAMLNALSTLLDRAARLEGAQGEG
jgi:uroporphyrinogen-III synthase